MAAGPVGERGRRTPPSTLICSMYTTEREENVFCPKAGKVASRTPSSAVANATELLVVPKSIPTMVGSDGLCCMLFIVAAGRQATPVVPFHPSDTYQAT